jgi:hypothetical protein
VLERVLPPLDTVTGALHYVKYVSFIKILNCMRDGF